MVDSTLTHEALSRFQAIEDRLDKLEEGTGEPILVADGETVDYSQYTKADLVAEHGARNLDFPSGATKADLVASLEANDAGA